MDLEPTKPNNTMDPWGQIQSDLSDMQRCVDSLEENVAVAESTAKLVKCAATVQVRALELNFGHLFELSNALLTILYQGGSSELYSRERDLPLLIDGLDLAAVLMDEWRERGGPAPAGNHEELDQFKRTLVARLKKTSSTEEKKDELIDWPAPATGIPQSQLEEFTSEANDNLLSLDNAMLSFEQHPSDLTCINEIFRAIHNIKGTARYIGLNQVAYFSHELENLLDALRKEKISANTAVSDLVFNASDALKDMIKGLGEGGEKDTDQHKLVHRLRKMHSGGDTEKNKAPAAKPAAKALDANFNAFMQVAKQQIDGMLGLIKKPDFATDLSAALGTLARMNKNLTNAAKFARQEKLMKMCEALSGGFVMNDAQEAQAEQILAAMEEQLHVIEHEWQQIIDVALANAEADGHEHDEDKTDGKAQPDVASRDQAVKGGADALIKVHKTKLEAYFNLAGELVIARNSMVHTIEQMQLNTEQRRALKETIDVIGRISDDVQNNAMSMRMVPLKTIMQRIPRIVRDALQGLDKRVKIELRGEDTELDRQVVEALGEPLVHIIRNSVDHGIETVKTRRDAGKIEEGTIRIEAGNNGNLVFIDIADDGKGIDIGRLRTKAVESGFMSAQEAEALSTKDVMQLIFKNGVSTAEKVTEISGRGVGMDIAKTNIERFGGEIFADSTPGSGTRFHIEMPLTLAVSKVILVAVGDEQYGIPMWSVREMVKVLASEVKSLSGELAISRRGSVVAIKTLSSILNRNSASSAEQGLDILNHVKVDFAGHYQIVIIDVGKDTFGLLVDRVIAQQEVVMKTLPSGFSKITGLSGATIAGDGSIILMLDPLGIYTLMTDGGAKHREEDADKKAQTESSQPIAG